MKVIGEGKIAKYYILNKKAASIYLFIISSCLKIVYLCHSKNSENVANP